MALQQGGLDGSGCEAAADAVALSSVIGPALQPETLRLSCPHTQLGYRRKLISIVWLSLLMQGNLFHGTLPAAWSGPDEFPILQNL